MDELGVENKNTFQDDASSLREGFRFLGWEITNTGRRPRESDYGSSVSLADSRFHPLFLCLNTTEVLKLFDSLLPPKHFAAMPVEVGGVWAMLG